MSEAGVLLTPPERRWECPCGRTKVTRVRPGEVDQPYHRCRLVGWLMAPYAEAGQKAKVTAHVREDYEQHAGIGGGIGEILARDDRGRPVMRVSVEQENGHMRHSIFVPCVTTNLGLR